MRLALLFRDSLAQQRESLAYALHIESLLAMAVLALVLASFERLATLPLLGVGLALPFARALGAGYLYLTFRKAALGMRRLPQARDYRDSWDAFIIPLVQGGAVLAWLWGALLVGVVATVGWSDFSERLSLSPVRFFRQPGLAPYLVLALWLSYLPVALPATILERRVLPLFLPWRCLRIAWPLLPRLRWPHVSLMALTVLSFAADSAALVLEQAVPIPFAAPIAAHMLTLVIPLAQVRLWGDAVYHARLASSHPVP